MSLLQETHNQYASFPDAVSCGDLHVSGAVDAPEVDATVLNAGAVVANSVRTATLRVTTTPTVNYVLTSDALGNASWQPVPNPPASLNAYGYAVGQSTATAAAGALINFDLGTVVNNTGFTSVPAASGTSFVIGTSGVYEYSLYVAAANGAATTQALEIALVVNATGPALANIFRSGLGAGATDPLVCVGSGLISLTAADVVSVRNITNSSTTAITFTSVPSGGVAGANRTLKLRRIA